MLRLTNYSSRDPLRFLFLALNELWLVLSISGHQHARGDVNLSARFTRMNKSVSFSLSLPPSLSLSLLLLSLPLTVFLSFFVCFSSPSFLPL